MFDVQPALLAVFRHGDVRLFIERTAGWFLGYNIYPGFVSVSTAMFMYLKQNLIHMCCSLKPTIFKLWIALNMHNNNTYLELMRTLKPTRLTVKIEILQHHVAESCTLLIILCLNSLHV